MHPEANQRETQRRRVKENRGKKKQRKSVEKIRNRNKMTWKKNAKK